MKNNEFMCVHVCCIIIFIYEGALSNMQSSRSNDATKNKEKIKYYCLYENESLNI